MNVTREGAKGIASIAEMVERLRASPPTRIGGQDVVYMTDYRARSRTHLATGTLTPITLPASNVLAFELASEGRVIARPSGTEPKAKFYFDVREGVTPTEDVASAMARAVARLHTMRASFMAVASD